MNQRVLGRSGIAVSTVSMGCWAFAGDWRWGPQDDEDSILAVRTALDLGINLFDTAEDYGRSEVIVGRALAGRRHEAVIATKANPSHVGRDSLQLACEQSLQRLGTDYIDLYQLHWPSRTVPLAETMEGLERLREQGKVRAIGVSNFGVQDLSDLLALGRCEADQLPYNLLCRAIEFGTRSKCVEEEIGILCYMPLFQGILAGKFASADEVPEARTRTRHFSGARPRSRHGEAGCEAETFAAVDRIRHISERIGEPMARVAIAWLLQQPGVTSVLAGARNPEQVRWNVESAGLELAPELTLELTAATEEVKQKLGPNADYWQSESRCR